MKLIYKFNTQGEEQKGNTTSAQNSNVNLRIRLTLKQYSTYLQVMFPETTIDSEVLQMLSLEKGEKKKEKKGFIPSFKANKVLLFLPTMRQNCNLTFY